MKIAYFTNHYPKVSHTFIRREIHALESRGVDVLRYAIRTEDEQLTDPFDLEERNKTQYLLSVSKFLVIHAFILTLIKAPLLFTRVFFLSFKSGLHSERGVLNHFFYFIEAILLKKLLHDEKIKQTVDCKYNV